MTNSLSLKGAKKKAGLLLALALLCSLLCPMLTVSAAEPALEAFPTELRKTVVSAGRYSNWAGVSSVSQFADENGNFCFAFESGGGISVYKVVNGVAALQCTIPNPYDSFGAAACDGDGNLYMVWGKNGVSEDRDANTIFVGKYTAVGDPVATVGGNGSEGMEWYYDSSFHTQRAFEGGNCDVAINGDLLVVNYARHMYSGHQSNTLLAVNTRTMTVQTGMVTYNSHSFDQRVTPWGENGFVLESQGDCFPRGFNTTLIGSGRTLNNLCTFNFWVEPNAYADYNMSLLNNTRSRLGNILETDRGAALVASSARSLSENAKSEPYDVFVQVFDPAGQPRGAAGYVTAGERSGYAGNNGDQAVTDYGVFWLTDLAGQGKTADVVQAVSAGKDTIVVLYELYMGGRYDSTWYMLLNGDGSVRREAASLGDVRLNIDEDPVYSQGAVFWISNNRSSDALVLHSLRLEGGEASGGSDPEAPGSGVDSGAGSEDQVVLSPQKLTVDGVNRDVEKYNINGRNYFKLRDLASLLDGTSARFSVRWDAAAGQVGIRTGESYVPVGGELVFDGVSKAASAVRSPQSIVINGATRSELSVYNIGNNNYFQLRELGELLNFAVDYDADSDTAIVYSGAPLTTPTPAPSPAQGQPGTGEAAGLSAADPLWKGKTAGNAIPLQRERRIIMRAAGAASG